MVYVFALAVLVLGSSTSPQGTRTPPDVVVIDGRLNPEQIPEYVMWRNAFDVVANVLKSNAPEPIASLELSSVDLQLLAAATQAHVAREAACHVKLERVIEDAKARQLAQAGVNKELKRHMLDCRQQVLDGSTRLLRSLSPEGQLALREWVNDQRKHLTVFVQRHELDYFWLPR